MIDRFCLDSSNRPQVRKFNINKNPDYKGDKFKNCIPCLQFDFECDKPKTMILGSFPRFYQDKYTVLEVS